MGARRTVPLLLTLAVLAGACGEQGQDRELATGPELKPTPPTPTSCSFTALPTLIRDYFPGPRQSPIVSLADLMAAEEEHTSGARDYGFQIMDSVGVLSRDLAVASDPAAGARLTIGLIYCMFSNAGDFTYPTTALGDFTKALDGGAGGAYYVRGGGTSGIDPTGRTNSVLGTDWTDPADPTPPTNLSGVRPIGSNSWTQVLTNTTNAGSEYRALLYGYRVGTRDDPLVYEWATVPSATEFQTSTGGAGGIVSVCDNSAGSSTAMVHESTIGVLAYAVDDVCDDTQSYSMLERGWGPRALAGRLARVVVDAVSPEPLQATVVRTPSGSGGTMTTFKSKFKTTSVTSVTFTIQAPKTIYLTDQPVTVTVRATTLVGTTTEGVNGTCVYLTGSNNNGQGTTLDGTQECDHASTFQGLSAQTKTLNGKAGYAVFEMTVGKTGGLTLTASSTDGTGTTGVVGRDGQTFVNKTFKTNVKP